MPQRFKYFLNCAAAAVAFALTASAIHFYQPMLPAAGIKPKFAYFTAHKDEYDAVFIGTSRVFSGVIPGTFDASLQERGIRMRSFNLGVSGMFPPEQFWMIRHVLAEKPKKMKWMFIEVAPILLAPYANSSARSQYWRDWAETGLALRVEWRKAIESRETPLKLSMSKRRNKRMRKLWETIRGKIPGSVVIAIRLMEDAPIHIGKFLQNQTNLGLAVTHNPVADLSAELDQSGGYNLPGEKGALTETKDVEEYRAKLAGALKPRKLKTDYETPPAYVAILAEIRRCGVTPVCFIAPIGRSDHFHVPPPPGETVYAFNRPDDFPELYDPAHRKDLDHLNGLGAAEWSRRLAESFAPVLSR